MCSIENKINSELLKSSKSDEEKKDEISGAGLHNIPIVSKEDIIKALKDVGVTPGSIVLIHSSLKSFGYVEGGALTVINAAKETVTERGTVVFPTLVQRILQMHTRIGIKKNLLLM